MIEFDTVTKSYGPKQVLKNVSFIVENGKVTSLVGKNGAGKSTTINIASNYINSTSGTVENNNISVMPDADNLYRDMTGNHFLKFMSKLKKTTDTNVIDKLSDDLGLTKDLNKKLKDYSFGMKKKIAFIQAYMGDYDNYIFDEPTSGVDYESAKIMMNYLRKLANANKAILMTSHNLEEIEEISDSIIFLSDGMTVTKQKSTDIKISFLLIALEPNDQQLIDIGFSKIKNNIYQISLLSTQINDTLKRVLNTNTSIKEFKLEKSDVAITLDNIETMYTKAT